MSEDLDKDTAEFVDAMNRADEVTRLIFVSVMRKRVNGSIASDQMIANLKDLLDRHRAGKTIYISELGIE